MSLLKPATSVQFWFNTCTLWQRGKHSKMLLTPISTKSSLKLTNKQKTIYANVLFYRTVAVFTHFHSCQNIWHFTCASQNTSAHTRTTHMQMYMAIKMSLKKSKIKTCAMSQVLRILCMFKHELITHFHGAFQRCFLHTLGLMKQA